MTMLSTQCIDCILRCLQSATFCPQSDWSGCVVRLAAHDFMDYRDGEPAAGADGCFHLGDIDNHGLSSCFVTGRHGISIMDAYVDFCSSISLADFIVIAAEAVMNITRQTTLLEDPSRQPFDFRSRFKYGRETSSSCKAALGSLPDAEAGCDSVQRILVNRMGLTWNQSAALMGAHTIGGASTERSGFHGRWTSAESSRKFDNAYYVSLVLNGWAPEHLEGQEQHHQWKRVDLGADSYRKGHEMMLDTDMCLYYTPFDYLHFDPNPLSSSSGKAQGCRCAWSSIRNYTEAIDKYNNGKFCGTSQLYPTNNPAKASGHQPELDFSSENVLNFTKERIVCCSMQDVNVQASIDCGIPAHPQGPAAMAVMRFANNEEEWISAFQEAWGIATTKVSSPTQLVALGA